jgi:ABC-type uncharacterized transport system permease subunit
MAAITSTVTATLLTNAALPARAELSVNGTTVNGIAISNPPTLGQKVWTFIKYVTAAYLPILVDISAIHQWHSSVHFSIAIAHC